MNSWRRRISYKTLIQGREQITCTVPLKWTGLRIYPGVRVQFTFPPYGWARKIFRCISWEFGGESPVSVVLQSDQAISWRDPTEGTYSHRDEQGTVILGEVEIPSPTAGGGMGGEITARNPGFEFGPVGWLSLDPSTILILKDTSTAHNGDWFARGTANGTYASRNELVMPVVPGQRVRVSGWVKSSADALFDQLRWRGRFMDVEPGNLTGAVDAYITDATTTWTQVYAVGEAPAGTEFVALNMSLINKISGQVFWDDGMLEINPGAKIGDDFVGTDGDDRRRQEISTTPTFRRSLIACRVTSATSNRSNSPR